MVLTDRGGKQSANQQENLLQLQSASTVRSERKSVSKHNPSKSKEPTISHSKYDQLSAQR